MAKKFDAISLGRGQDKKAENCINENAGRGGWALLMNCHLASSFMPKLEHIVENLDDSSHRDFRLWMTSMPSKAFPVSVLQNSVKMTLEPPSGLKQNVLGTYDALDWKEVEDSTKPDKVKRLLFGFCFFHAIVQDRRKFGPIGWNIPYAFTNEDLMVSRKQLRIFVEDYTEVPYKVLNYVGAEVNYGGRVTDDKDGRLIRTILRTYICPEVMQDGHKLSASGKYYVIPPGDKEDYLDYIRTLPLNPAPEAFGLHANAEITTCQIETVVLLESVLSMQPRAGGGSGQSRETTIGQQARELQARTPPEFDLEAVANAFPTSYAESMNTVLFQECVRYNRLLAAMALGLAAVQKALVGEVVMSEELEKMADAIYDNQVPAAWAATGFLSLKPLASWIEDCNARIDFLRGWITKGTPWVYWISGLFFPQAFLTGTLQNYARQNTIAVDKLSYDFVYRDDISYTDITEKPASGCLSWGMYLEGCKWDYEQHEPTHSDPKKLFVDLPLLHLIPIEDRAAPEAGVYHCPVYKVLSRTGTLSTTGHSTNFVMWLELPAPSTCAVDEDLWIKAGVAAFLALRY